MIALPRIRPVATAATLVLAGLLLALPASAEAVSAPVKKSTPLDMMGKRLSRGSANTALGWLEIPAGVREIGNKHGVGAAATWGVIHGSGRAVQRTAVGLFELFTFPFTLTQENKPMIEPEFVLSTPSEAVVTPSESQTSAASL
jgi:putative exosortase-associated protein (TIGR04073 family)